MNRPCVLFSPIPIISLISIIFGVFFITCNSNPPIRLGYLGSISGCVADIGIAGRDAVQLSVAQCNAHGGIHGLLAVDPDGLLIIANPMDSAFLCQQIRKSNPSAKITLSNWASTQRLIELGGRAVEGVTLPIAFGWNSPSPPYQTFRKIYLDRFHREPGFPGFYAYNAAQVVLTALNT